MTNLRTGAVFLLVLLTACTATSTAAQESEETPTYRPGIHPWAVMYETRWRSEITDQTLEELIDRVELDADRQAIAEQLLADHRARFAELVARGKVVEDEIHAKLAESRPSSMDRAKLEVEREKLLSPFVDEQNALDERLLDEWATLINPDDEREQWRWRHFRWWLARDRWFFPAAEFPASEVDLLEVLRDAEIEPEDSIDPPAFRDVMDSYARHTHEYLMKRIELERDIARTMEQRTFHRLETDGERVWQGRASEEYYAWIMVEMPRTRAASVRGLRDVHRTHHDLLVSLLPQAEHETFAQAYNRELLMRAWDYHRNPYLKSASVLFEQVKQHEGLFNAQQQTQFDAMELEFRTEIEAAIRERIELTNRAIERKMDGKPIVATDNEVWAREGRKALNRLYEVEGKHSQRLWEFLTPEQRMHFKEPIPARYQDLETGRLLPVGEKPK